jgi:hypothetical protein
MHKFLGSRQIILASELSGSELLPHVKTSNYYDYDDDDYDDDDYDDEDDYDDGDDDNDDDDGGDDDEYFDDVMMMM